MNWQPKIEYTELETGTPKTITFDSSPEGDPFNEGFTTNKKEKRSLSGQRQTHFNYHLKKYKVEFLFQSKTVRDAVEDFYLNHAAKGGGFDYFPSSDEIDKETFELAQSGVDFSRPIPDSGTDFEYNFTLNMERVV